MSNHVTYEVTPFRRESESSWFVGIDPQRFEELRASVVASGKPDGRSRFQRLCWNNLVMESGSAPDSECKIFEDAVLGVRATDSGLLVVHRTRTRRPFHAFPSTTRVHDAAWVDRTCVAIGQGVHMVFEETWPCYETSQPSTERTFRVFCTSGNDAKHWLGLAAKAMRRR